MAPGVVHGLSSARAVLFDLDGTLLDTLEDLALSGNAVLAALGHPVHPTGAYRYFVGRGLRELAANMLPEQARTPEETARAFQLLMPEYRRRQFDHTRPYPGIPELLDFLRTAGLKLAVLSNKAEPLTRELAARFFAPGAFQEVWGARSDRPLKPAPEGALGLATALGVPPEQFLYLGDTRVDMLTARAAGMVPVGVLWGFREAAELQEAGAAHLLARPGELRALL